METSVTKKGQTNIPAAIRKRYQIREGDRLAWLDDGETIHVVPLPAEDPVAALRGSARGKGLTERLLLNRREDRKRGA
jgi:AbrB family looped-hinge helix DNA binding protein